MDAMPRFLVIFLLLVAAGFAQAAERRFPLETGQTFVIQGPSDWVQVANEAGSQPGTVTLAGPDPKLWHLAVGPLPPHPTLTGDVGNLRIYLRALARGLEEAGVDVDTEHKTLDGGQVRGFYLAGHDARPKTKALLKLWGGDYSHIYLGAVSIGSKPYLFEVVWAPGGEAAAKAALAAVRTIRIQ